jgi:hypothetical protein
MELVRLATVHLTRPKPFALGQWDYNATNGLIVKTASVEGADEDLTNQTIFELGQHPRIAWPFEHTEVRLSVSASLDAGSPTVIDGHLSVPDEPRSLAEVAIGEYADMLGVLHQCRRTIRSPRSCVAQKASDPDEVNIFNEVRFLHQPEVGRVQARTMPPAIPEELLNGLRDRIDGLALLADSLAEDGAVGRCRDLFRLFERGFRRASEALIDPLSTFLRSNPRNDRLHYSREEIEIWLKQVRPRTMHADNRRTIARSPEVEPYLGRMEWAAYDVLFNKVDWRRPSAHRRRQQDFLSGISPDRTQALLFHPGATVLQEWIDPFGVYPIDHTASVTFPDGWIWRFPGQ